MVRHATRRAASFHLKRTLFDDGLSMPVFEALGVDCCLAPQPIRLLKKPWSEVVAGPAGVTASCALKKDVSFKALLLVTYAAAPRPLLGCRRIELYWTTNGA